MLTYIFRVLSSSDVFKFQIQIKVLYLNMSTKKLQKNTTLFGIGKEVQ
jgi:hypothetical protein